MLRMHTLLLYCYVSFLFVSTFVEKLYFVILVIVGVHILLKTTESCLKYIAKCCCFFSAPAKTPVLALEHSH